MGRACRGRPVSSSITFDTGALLAIERNTARAKALVAALNRSETAILVPAGVLAQAYRGTARQHALNAFLKLGNVHVLPLDTAAALRAGILCGERGTSDVVDASVVICANVHDGTKVVTSDPDDLAHLDPKLRLEVL